MVVVVIKIIWFTHNPT